MMNNTYNCIIIDDEPKAIELLVDSLRIVRNDITVLATYTSWADALNAIRTQPCDIIFLDISIQGRNGMDLLHLVPDLQSEVIFVTAYSDHAVNAFKFSATGYVLKPINDVELAATIDRTIKKIEMKRQAQKSGVQLDSRIGIPGNKSINYVATGDIIYLEAQNTYTKVVTKDQEILSAYNIGKFRELLPANIFYQVHRSFIINLNRIVRYENTGTVVMDNNQKIPVSIAERTKLLSMFTHVKQSK
jgi:two-component system, LytTR family, response regulator